MNTATFPGIITNEQFENATELWREAVNNSSAALQESFTYGGGILASVKFSADQIISLVSSVGVTHIKARFGLLTDESTGQQRFNVILFAANSRNEPVSAYYINGTYWTVSAPTPAPPQVEVPNSLAQVWLDNWHEVSQVTPAMFAVPLGALQGYTFEAEDFIRPLAKLQKGVETSLQVRFALHKYYQNGPDGSPVEARTFGLVLQLSSASQPSEPMFDISMPCPYTC